MVTKEINKLKDNTAAFKQTGLDVKFVADRLMSKIVSPFDFTSRLGVVKYLLYS